MVTATHTTHCRSLLLPLLLIVTLASAIELSDSLME